MKPTNLFGAAGLAAATLAFLAASGGCQDQAVSPHLKGQVHLTLIHTADMHSRLFPYNLQLGQTDAGLGLGTANTIVNVGGAARVSHIVGRERARANRVLHLDGGDCFQGAPVFNFYSGEAEIRTESAIGTDAMVLANHEFDRGAVNIGNQLQKWANFPVLAANYQFTDPTVPGASQLGGLVQPFTVFDVQGLRVGVIGMANLSALSSIFNTPNSFGITPLDTNQTAQFYVDLVRPMVDVVVILSHLGVDVDQTMIQATSGIDVVLGGHNHIVLQPPKQVLDCSANCDLSGNNCYLELDPPTQDPVGGCHANKDCSSGAVCNPATHACRIHRACKPRKVLLQHSGAFAKFVGRLDAIFTNDPAELPATYDPVDGFELLTHEYNLLPVTEQTPEDPVILSLLEPYQQGLDAIANLNLLVGYALDGSKRNTTSGGDSALGNLIATSMWLRIGIQTDFSLTNTTGIRADLVPGPVDVEQMYNVFPFDNSITKMQVSGVEIQELFDFVARRSSGRGCVSQVQIAGARVVMDCTKQTSPTAAPGQATAIYIGTYNPTVSCQRDGDCPGAGVGSCDPGLGVCWQPITPINSYELATSNYLAGGGSGFVALRRNTTQLDTGVQQRDALIDYIRGGKPCGADANGSPHPCAQDTDCGGVGAGYVCACPESVIDNETMLTCTTDPKKSCTPGSTGACVLDKCRNDLANLQRATCDAAISASVRKECLRNLTPCSAGGEQCKYLACLDRRLGNYSDGRITMVGQ